MAWKTWCALACGWKIRGISASFNKVFSEYFKPEHAPARACVQANMMVDCKVEIDCIAYKKKA